MNEREMREYLTELLEDDSFDSERPTDRPALARVVSFEEKGFGGYNEGCVVRFADGSEFQVTIVQSERGSGYKPEDDEEESDEEESDE